MSERCHTCLFFAARLNEERARSDRLRRQVEVARALASLDNDGTPAMAATQIARLWRGHRARLAAAPLLAASTDAAAARAIAARAAAGRVATALRDYVLSTLPRLSKTALRRESLRLRGQLAEARAATARKDVQLERAIERQIEAHQHQREAMRMACESAAASAAEEADRAARRASEVREAAMRQAMGASLAASEGREAELTGLVDRLQSEVVALREEVAEQVRCRDACHARAGVAAAAAARQVTTRLINA